MLVGRDAELGRVRELTDGIAQGRSGVLVVAGEPGIGKTALLRAAIESAGDARVLRATGVQSESELPFAGLHELLRPVLELVGRLVPRQAQALVAALETGGAADRFAASAALLALLAEAAPLLAVVDDAQWLDAASAEALAFAGRRLEAEGVALLVAVRSGAPTPFDVFPRLRLAPLAEPAARALAARGRPEAVERVVEAAAGNPLALVELTAAGGGELLVERLFGAQVAALPAAAETAALVAALSDDEALEPVLTAAGALGVDLADWEEAEAAGVVEIEPGRVRFRHPLLRTAVQERAAPRARREAHRPGTARPARSRRTRTWPPRSSAPPPTTPAAAATSPPPGRSSARRT
jgi:hypothetical protein